MHHHRPHPSRLRLLLLAALLLIAPAAFAGPPTLCHPFDTAGAPSLPWGQGSGWNSPRSDYDRSRLATDTLTLLGPRTPVIARMETLRRAAIYASADGAVVRDLAARLDARIARAGNTDTRATALFDAGYFAETLQDIVRLQGYDMPGIGKVDTAALRELLAKGEGSRRIAQAQTLHPRDMQLRFAAAVVAAADQRRSDYAANARLARAGARGDRLLARNIGQLGG